MSASRLKSTSYTQLDEAKRNGDCIKSLHKITHEFVSLKGNCKRMFEKLVAEIKCSTIHGSICTSEI